MMSAPCGLRFQYAIVLALLLILLVAAGIAAAVFKTDVSHTSITDLWSTTTSSHVIFAVVVMHFIGAVLWCY